jgi:hypothetical protein
VALAPFDFLVTVIANVFMLRCRFDALRVNTASRRLGVAALSASLQLAQSFHQPRPDAVASPALKIAINGTPMAKFLGH